MQTYLIVNNFINKSGQNWKDANKYQQQAMGNYSKTCLNCQEDNRDSYSMIILNNRSLSSISKFKQCRTLSTNQSQEGDAEDLPIHELHYLTGQSLKNEGQYQLAVNQFMAALRHLHKSDSSFPILHFNIAKCYLHMQKYKPAFQHCKIAYERYKQTGEDASLGICAQLLGEIKIKEEDCVLGVFYYEKALQVYEREGEEKSMEVMYILGIIYMETGEWDKVIKLFLGLQGIIQRRQYRIEKEHVFRVYFTLGKVYSMKGMFQISISYFSKSIEMVLLSSKQYGQICGQVERMVGRMRQVVLRDEWERLMGIIKCSMPLLHIRR